MTEVVFSVFDDGLGPVFGSLYARPAELLHGGGLETRVVSFARIGEYARPALARQWRRRKQEFSRALPGRLSRWPLVPSRIAGGPDIASIAAWLVAHRYRQRGAIMHCGGALASTSMIKAARLAGADGVRVVHHSWGPFADEYAYGVLRGPEALEDPAQRAAYERNQRIEAFAYRNADGVVAISDAMMAHARDAMGDSGRPLTKIPCFVDTGFFSDGAAQRGEMRARLGLSDEPLFVYSGSLHPWQRVDRLLDLFARIHAARPDARLLILTPQAGWARLMCGNAGIAESARTILTAPFKETPAWLAAADIGLLGRGLFEPASVVNTFSSPIKIPEYLAAGCPVVLGAHVGDFSALMRQTGLGVVAEDDIEIDGLAERIVARLPELTGEGARSACRELAAARFDLAANLNLYRDLYDRISE